ncbi:MAG: radical SAM protein, partial [Phycisphaerae bacterium]|nr:radical SAM protein [Phycisphaerae bacterium]
MTEWCDGGAGTLKRTIGLPLLSSVGDGCGESPAPARRAPRTPANGRRTLAVDAPTADSALPAAPARERLVDSHGRVITDLRLSITDRCNFRCVYCLDPGVRFAPPRTLLSVDEMLLLAEVCVDLGIDRIRVTGGEPTLHPELERILRSLSSLPLRDLSMTTNGALASRDSMRRWRDAGLRRLTFSLDAVSERGFERITRSRVPVSTVIEAIETAIELGLSPVKVNAVVMRGRNEEEVPALAALSRRLGFEMRFIEYMPLDSGRRWDATLLVTAEEILARAAEAGSLRAIGRDERQSTS